MLICVLGNSASLGITDITLVLDRSIWKHLATFSQVLSIKSVLKVKSEVCFYLPAFSDSLHLFGFHTTSFDQGHSSQYPCTHVNMYMYMREMSNFSKAILLCIKHHHQIFCDNGLQ